MSSSAWDRPINGVSRWLLGVPWTSVSLVGKGTLGAGGVLLLAAFALSMYDIQSYIGTDLRARVVGARALMMGLDPYFFPVGPDTPELLQHPTRTYANLLHAYPPTLLSFYALLAWMPYQPQHVIWSLLEWLALIGTILVGTRMAPPGKSRVAYLGMGLLLFAGSAFWRLHVERGQYYIFPTFLITLAASMLLRRRGKGIASGLLIGLATALRPSTVAMSVLLWFVGCRRAAVTAVLSALCLFALTFAWTPLSAWTSFRKSVDLHIEAAMSDWNGPARDWPKPYHSGKPVEGWPAVTPREPLLPLPSYNMGLTNLIHEVFKHTPGVGARPQLAVACGKGTAALILAAFVVAAIWTSRCHLAFRYRLAMVVVGVAALDYAAPIRQSYADVILLAPLALLLPVLLRRPAPWFFLALIWGGLAVGQTHLGIVNSVPILSGSFLQLVGTMGGILLATLWLLYRVRHRSRLPRRRRMETPLLTASLHA